MQNLSLCFQDYKLVEIWKDLQKLLAILLLLIFQFIWFVHLDPIFMDGLLPYESQKSSNKVSRLSNLSKLSVFLLSAKTLSNRPKGVQRSKTFETSENFKL